ncbi:MAG: ABC transporter permease [Gammaproteobacteria bacterium]|nr:ABC transporter permease [Gammaproteobacteria bacterium]
MRAADVLSYAYGGVVGYRLRSALMLFAMAVGVASVVMLTGLGEGARRYVTGEFASLGTHLLIVLPGRNETTGGAPPLLGETPRDLTLDDALALKRSASVRRIAPVTVGSAPVSFQQREREVMTIGTTWEFLHVRRLKILSGRFLPETDPRRAVPVCVLGGKLKRELFGNRAAVGQWVRVGDRRFRVIGVLASEGRAIGIDLEDMVVVPVASAQALFDTPSLFRILVEARSESLIESARREILAIVRARHEGEDDITVITQDAVIGTFNKIFNALTMTVGGIAAISLAVAGILIMNVMLVAVSQRTAEIGVIKALGATRRDILTLFLTEAGVMAAAGAGIGLALGYAAAAVTAQIYPVLSITAPLWAAASALMLAVGLGIVFGVLPARRAAALDPIAALARR